MRARHIDVITLGCSKNLVDSEQLMHRLAQAGFSCSHDSKHPTGEIAVINTCGFIGDAKEDSINTILEFAERKEKGLLSRLYVMGCLSQRYREELQREIPQVDRYYGKFDFQQLADDLAAEPLPRPSYQRVLTTPPHYAYVKISEGCDRHCAYCAIPIITGKHRSRPMQEILDEVRMLVGQGVTEFQVIAQETTFYGLDIDGRQQIAMLIDRMASIPGVRWIRVHYAYPTHFPMELLDVMNRHSNVCRYLDIALQHISDHVLTDMHRHITRQETYDLISAIREKVPGIALRTTMMVGFPGETDDDFQQLLDFVRWARFERLGAFAYSEEEGTFSAKNYSDNVSDEVKQQRLGTLMALQQEISEEMQQQMVGRTLCTVIDRREGNYYIGRTEFSSPEVDPEVLIPAGERQLRRGHYYDVLINDATEFDLFGSVAHPHTF